MILSFDLDGTLFVDPLKVDVEEAMSFPFGLYYKERLRKGTVDLFATLARDGHKSIIYTTSFREAGYIRGYFKRYGIRFKPSEIVNGARHAIEVL